jgi:putative PIN family toxin of toxin-antitoxin system
MTDVTTPLRLVLDTNVWLDWLAFDDDAIAPLKSAQAAGAVEIFSNEACARELVAVLNYDLGKRSLGAATQATCLATFKTLARTANRSASTATELPKCRDPDDQKFLELARDCAADYLVTKDKALLVLARRKMRPAPCGIVAPQELGVILENGRGQAGGPRSK